MITQRREQTLVRGQNSAYPRSKLSRRWIAAFMLVVVAVLPGIIWAAMQSQPGELVVGRYGDWLQLSGVYRPEQAAPDQHFRWTNGNAHLQLPAPGDRGLRTLNVTLSSGRPEAPVVRLGLKEQQLVFIAGEGQRHYQVLLRPAAASAPLTLTIASDTFVPAGRDEQLGVMFYRASIRPVGGIL